jgi:hypothetical protein
LKQLGLERVAAPPSLGLGNVLEDTEDDEFCRPNWRYADLANEPTV